jgi:hypothetical protein
MRASLGHRRPSIRPRVLAAAVVVSALAASPPGFAGGIDVSVDSGEVTVGVGAGGASAEVEAGAGAGGSVDTGNPPSASAGASVSASVAVATPAGSVNVGGGATVDVGGSTGGGDPGPGAGPRSGSGDKAEAKRERADRAARSGAAVRRARDRLQTGVPTAPSELSDARGRALDAVVVPIEPSGQTPLPAEGADGAAAGRTLALVAAFLAFLLAYARWRRQLHGVIARRLLRVRTN